MFTPRKLFNKANSHLRPRQYGPPYNHNPSSSKLPAASFSNLPIRPLPHKFKGGWESYYCCNESQLWARPESGLSQQLSSRIFTTQNIVCSKFHPLLCFPVSAENLSLCCQIFRECKKNKKMARKWQCTRMGGTPWQCSQGAPAAPSRTGWGE